MNCYFDGSVGGKSDEWLTLGGIAAPDSTWTTLQDQWKVMLSDRDPAAPYVHMTDLITGNREFRSTEGWTPVKVKRLVSDVITLMGSTPPANLCAFACAIDVKAHKRLLKEGYDIGDPAVICAQLGACPSNARRA